MLTKHEYEKLCDEIWQHNRRYFQEAKPTISDEEYDRLVKCLDAMEEAHPEWISDTSPTRRVGEKPLSGFQEITHSKPMLSLEKVFSQQELEDFHHRLCKLLGVKNVDYSAELKMDGLAIAVTYEEGHYVRAVTRGDGKVGSDVTQNITTVRSLPLRLACDKVKIPKILEVRGEVFLPIQAFEKMNRERAENGEELWANPRNAAAGSLKLLDPHEVAKRKELEIVFYGAVYEPGFPVKSQYALHDYFKELGLPQLPLQYIAKCHSVDEVMHFAIEIEKKRKSLPFGIDGIVIKVNNLQAFEEVGNTGKHPRGACAYKFSAEQAWTCIRQITVQVGRTGVLTPVAELEPVLLAGSRISRATLHNFDEMQRKDIRISDVVLIEKGGDVIPKVVAVDLEQRKMHSEPFAIPTVCPSCGTPVVKDPQEVAWRCPNVTGCPDQVLRGLIHFAGKDGLDIENLGEKVMEQLVKLQFVKKPSDIFLLASEQLATLEGFKEKSIHNLLESIEKAKKVTLAKLLMALGIRYIGVQAAQTLADRAKSITALAVMTKEELLNISGIGEKVATSLIDYFTNQANREELEKLKLAGLVIEIPSFAAFEGHIFFNKSIVLTGSLQHFSRHDAEARIQAVGGKVSDSVSKKTDFVVVGADAGSKLEKAKKLQVPILNEEEFLQKLCDPLIQ